MARVRLSRGAAAPGGRRRTAELLAAEARGTVPVLDAGGETVAGVRVLEVLVENIRLTEIALAGIGDVVITTSGDCGGGPGTDLCRPRPAR